MLDSKELMGLIRKIEGIDAYDRIEELDKAMFFEGDYQKIRVNNDHPVFLLDNINYNKHIVSDPLPIDRLMELFDISPSYGTTDSEYECGEIIRTFEAARALDSISYYQSNIMKYDETAINEVSVAISTGTTGATFMVISAILKYYKDNFIFCKEEIVFNTPTYSVIEGIARYYGLVLKEVAGDEENCFLSSIDQLTSLISEKTLVCFITYPTNPAQSSWGKKDIEALKKLVDKCQMYRVFLIADTIFQDINYKNTPIPELFAIADSLDYIGKVFSPSKDRPLSCGYRVGYFIGAKKLKTYLSYVNSLTINSINTISKTWFSFDILFRIAMQSGGLKVELFDKIANRYVFGYRANEEEPDRMYRLICLEGLYVNYTKAVNSLYNYIHESKICLAEFFTRNIKHMKIISESDYGNILYIKLKPEKLYKSDIEFFFDILLNLNIAFLVGSCFGTVDNSLVYFRLALGGESVVDIMSHLKRIDNFIEGKLVNGRKGVTTSENN